MSAEETEPTPSLSPDVVIDAAMRLVRDQGLPALTMRAVAADLGVTPMALYYHVASKDELLALILRRVLSGTAPLRTGGGAWEDELREHLLSRWRVLRAYPGLVGYLTERPTAISAHDDRRKGVEFFTVEVGLPPDVAELAWSFALTYIHGRLSAEAHISAESARAAGLDFRTARDHVEFGVEAVIVALREIRADPTARGRLDPPRTTAGRTASRPRTAPIDDGQMA